MGRAPCCEKVGLRRGRWTAEEDDKLINYILQHGEGSWRSLPKNAGLLRCGKSCRLRWINYLRSDLKRGNISPQEEDIIIRLHATLGNRWSTIAAQLPGRTDNEIKNYWNSHLSRRIHTIRRPNGEKDVINLSNVSAPPKRRGGRRSRAAMQRNKTNNPIISDNNNTDTNNNNNNNNNNVNVGPQFGPTFEDNIVRDENLMFDQEQELLGIDDVLGLDGLLSTKNEDTFMDNDMGPTDGPKEKNSGLAHGSNSIESNGGGTTSTSSSPSILSCFDNIDGGMDWNMEIGMFDDVGSNFQMCDEKDQIISWLWENDDSYLEKVQFSDVAVNMDSDKEQAMVAWLLS